MPQSDEFPRRRGRPPGSRNRPKPLQAPRGTGAVEAQARLSPNQSLERMYDAEETDFLRAVEERKKQTGRGFLPLCEVLAVVKALGYVKVAPTGDDDA